LGYWMSNPASEEDHGKPPIRGGMLYYYLKELFGAASGKDRFIYLTDGGHFDNSGIYELLRRRCRYVIAVDGSGEPSPTSPMFGTLGQLARLARIDFGIDIRMDLRPLTPSPETGKAPSNWAIGTITYPPVERGLSEEERERDRQGMMVYLKAVVTEADNLPDLEFYHRRDNIFPNHPTLDQFFDEAQFEAYRALGYQIAKGIFEGKFRTGSKVNSDREAFNSLCTHR
jgi:hypothetical protein